MTTPTLSSLVSRLRVLRYGDRPRPQRDWSILAAITGLLFVFGAVWSYFVFLQASQVEIPAAAAATASGVNAASIDSVTRVFQSRAAERAHYLNDYRFVDPSH